MGSPIPTVGRLDSFGSQEEEEHAEATCGSRSPLPFSTPAISTPASWEEQLIGHLEANTGYLGRPINLKYLCNSNSSKIFLPILGREQQNRESMLRNRVLLRQLGVTFTCNVSQMPQTMSEDKHTPFHV